MRKPIRSWWCSGTPSADYKTVTVVDTRYIAADYVSNFVDFHGQDILMVYSTLIINSSNTLK